MFIPASGEEKVTVGNDVYPRPLETISTEVTEPSFTAPTAVAGTPQGSLGLLKVISTF